MFRTALLILSGNATASLLLLARNLIVARLIPVEDYGIAATFAVVMAMVEMASAFGLQQQIVQSKDGDGPQFQAALQGFQVLRGLVASVALYFIAEPIANFLGIPEVIWAYQLLALVPAIKALEHFDIHRFNRQMRFWPLVLTGGVPALVSLLLVWPLVAWLDDWRVMLYAILAEISIRTITSHYVSERAYSITFDIKIMRSSLRFGWPILANALLLFLVFQGDKLIVGRVLGIEALAIFAMGMTLTLTPTMIIQGSVLRFFLPQLSKHNRKAFKGEKRFQHLAMVVSEINMLLAIGFVFLIVIFNEIIVEVLLTSEFSHLKEIFVLLAVLQCIRILKGGPATVALANGQTENAMLANLARVSVLPIAYFAAIRTGRLDSLIIVALFGEILGFLVALYFLHTRSSVNVRPLVLPSFFTLLFFALCVFKEITAFDEIVWVVLFSVFICGCLSMQNIWRYSLRRFRK